MTGPAVTGPAVSGPAASGPAASGPAASGPAASGPVAVVEKAGARPRSSYRRGVWALMAPFLIGSLALVLLPAVISAAFAFTRYDGLGAPSFVGLDVFRDLAGDKELRRALATTGIFLVIAVPLRIAGGLALALLLFRSEPGTRAGRVGAYAPTVIPDAAMALVWLWIVNPFYGPVGVLARASGLDIPILLDTWGRA